jgi:hypothetical protein
MLQFHTHIKRSFVFPAINDLAEKEGVIEFDLQGGADGDGTLEFKPHAACGDVLDASGEMDVGFTKDSDPNRLFGLDAQFAPLIHSQHIGRQEGKV